MSEENKKEEEITITLKMKKSLYDNIVKQFEVLKGKDMEGLSNVKSIEEFILFYLKWLSNEGDHFKEIENRMQDILNVLKDKGIDLLNELNLGRKSKKDKEDDDDLEVDEEEESEEYAKTIVNKKS